MNFYVRHCFCFLGITFILGCTADDREAKVGTFEITKKAVMLRDEVAKTYYPHDVMKRGREQLITHYTQAQILMNHGIELSKEALVKEAARIDETTQDPKMLKKMKDLFGDDYDAYLNVFVLPVLAETEINEYFKNDPGILAESQKEARLFLEKAKKDTFDSVTKSERQKTVRFTASPVWGLRDQDFIEAMKTVPRTLEGWEKGKWEPSGEGIKWMKEIAPKMKNGQIYSEIVSYKDHWAVIRYIGKTKSGFPQFEGVLFPKLAFDQWLEREKDNVKIVLK